MCIGVNNRVTHDDALEEVRRAIAAVCAVLELSGRGRCGVTMTPTTVAQNDRLRHQQQPTTTTREGVPLVVI